MFDVGWQLWLALLVIWSLFVLALAGARPWKLIAAQLALPDEDVAADYPSVEDEAAWALLLAEAKAAAKRDSGAVRSLETQAAVAFFVVAVGLGFLGFAALSADRVQSTAWFAIALWLLFFALIANAICLQSARVPAPLPQSDRIEIARSFLCYDRRLRGSTIRKRRWQLAGNVLVVLAAFALMLNYFTADKRADQSLHLNCQPIGTNYNCARQVPPVPPP